MKSFKLVRAVQIELEVLVFEERGKPKYVPEKTSRSKGENQQQTQSTYDV